MSQGPMSEVIARRLHQAAVRLHTVSPLEYVKPMLERAFPLPAGSREYAANALTPGAAPCEPSFSEQEPDVLRFTVMPLGPCSSPLARRNEATREMRRLVDPVFGRDALRWFDARSEEWRGVSSPSGLGYGAWFGTAYDDEGLTTAKVYYELQPEQLESLPPGLKATVQAAAEVLPSLVPVFTSIRCGRDVGGQRVTFLHRGPLKVNALGPLLERLGMGHQLSGLLRAVGLTLGGRFELPERSVLIGLGESNDGPEVKLEVLLGAIPDVPAGFLDLLSLGLAERPRQLQALNRWLWAFTPDAHERPGEFSVMSVRVTPAMAARVSLYLRPVEFEIRDRSVAARRRPELVGAGR